MKGGDIMENEVYNDEHVMLYECSECCWYGKVDDLENESCPCCGNECTAIIDQSEDLFYFL